MILRHSRWEGLGTLVIYGVYEKHTYEEEIRTLLMNQEVMSGLPAQWWNNPPFFIILSCTGAGVDTWILSLE